jgi:hypothetical protein
MVYYGSVRGPLDLLQNEWVLFATVFLLSFSMVYISLTTFFHKKKNLSTFERLLDVKKKDSDFSKGPFVVIAACVALLISVSLTRANYLQAYLGVGSTLAILVFSLIIFVILTLPFYKMLESKFGPVVGAPLFFSIVWFVLKFLVPYNTVSYFPYFATNWYDLAVQPFVFWWGLVISFLVGGLLSWINKSH